MHKVLIFPGLILIDNGVISICFECIYDFTNKCSYKLIEYSSVFGEKMKIND